MSRNILLEKIKQAEAVASEEVEKAEKEHISATNRIPLDQEAIIKEKREKAKKASQSDIDKAMKDIEKQKADILSKGKKANSKMKDDANTKVGNAAGKFVDKFLESLS
jgi:vacuolar-type H+-ATPase subunit H|tara:strand:+ start:1615 stop:1938 length:324 start_codon:yes stop_codon:yes gene_type:complete